MQLRILVTRERIMQDYECLRLERPHLSEAQLLHLAAQPYLLVVKRAWVVQGIPIEVMSPFLRGFKPD